MHDLIIRGGTVVDGTGAPAYKADIAIDNGRISVVGTVDGAAREVIEATDLLVTPGFVDIHTHYDGQVTWDPLITPSCWHGVTTVVMGNCGVGFAPVRPAEREWVLDLMEGVEDIPGSALAAGIRWNWETFPEYLDSLEQSPSALDFATQIPHGTVRAYVMGERGASNQPANREDIDQMAAIVAEGLKAGALGFSTSRIPGHRTVSGEPVPGTYATEDELFGIGKALGEVGLGLMEVVPSALFTDDLSLADKEVAWMRKLSAVTGRPVTFVLVQHYQDPDGWRKLLDASEQAAAEGARLYPQVHGRAPGRIFGLQVNHPFETTATFKALAGLPLAEKVEQLRRPHVREQVLREFAALTPDQSWLVVDLSNSYPLQDPPDYEPSPDQSVRAIAARNGRPEYEQLYDLMLQRDGKQWFLLPFTNYFARDLEVVRQMLQHPRSALGLADGGAHCNFICDGSVPTFMLTHWVRDRSRGPRLPLEFVVKKMTQDTASLYGLHDRGVIRPGMKGDVNVIDLERLRMKLPELVYNLPAQGQRLIQKSEGYVATVVSGEVVMRNGEHTGALPGKLIRGAQQAAVAV